MPGGEKVERAQLLGGPGCPEGEKVERAQLLGGRMPGGGKVDDLGLARRGLMPLRKKKRVLPGGKSKARGGNSHAQLLVLGSCRRICSRASKISKIGTSSGLRT